MDNKELLLQIRFALYEEMNAQEKWAADWLEKKQPELKRDADIRFCTIRKCLNRLDEIGVLNKIL